MMKTCMKTEDCHEDNSVDDDDENSHKEWTFTMKTIAMMRMKISMKTEGCYENNGDDD